MRVTASAVGEASTGEVTAGVGHKGVEAGLGPRKHELKER